MDNIDPEVLSDLIRSGTIVAIAVLLIIILKRVLDLALKRTTLPLLMFRPLRIILYYLVLILAVASVLNVWGIRTETLLASLGAVLGLIAIGFVAVWSILSNFLCTFVLIMIKPFSIGDEIEIPADSVSGKVVDLTMMFTVLRTDKDEYVQVPNNQFFQKIFKRKIGSSPVSLEEQLVQTKPVE
jgi:small-conductance mechanosensitive channel